MVIYRSAYVSQDSISNLLIAGFVPAKRSCERASAEMRADRERASIKRVLATSPSDIFTSVRGTYIPRESARRHFVVFCFATRH